MHERRSGRPALLRPLVAFHAARVVVFGLAFFVGELHAVHAAVARVHHVDVVDEAAKDARASGSIGPDPIAVHRNELLVLGMRRTCDRECRGAQERGSSDFPQHWNPPLDGKSPCFLQVIGMNSRAYYSPIAGAGKTGPLQCGKGQSRSFSLAICHRRAWPSGSTTRKKMMSAPNRIRVRLDTNPAGRARPKERSIEVAERSMKIGRSTMKAAPRNEPRMLPTPPTMIMKRILKERSSSNPAGSTVPRYANA